MGVLNHARKPMLASSISRRKEVSCDWLINENIVCQLLVMSSRSQCVNSECIDWYYVACIILPLLGKLCSFHNKSVKFRMCCLNNSYRWHGDPGAKATSAIYSVDKPPLEKYFVGWHRLFGYLIQTIFKTIKIYLRYQSFIAMERSSCRCNFPQRNDLSNSVLW